MKKDSKQNNFNGKVIFHGPVQVDEGDIFHGLAQVAGGDIFHEPEQVAGGDIFHEPEHKAHQGRKGGRDIGRCI